MQTKKYHFTTCKKAEESDIIYVQFAKDLKVDLVIAKELVFNRLDFTENKKHYLIIDFSNITNVSPQAKIYMQDPETGLKNILGAAFIASNPVSTLLANIFTKTSNIDSKFLRNEKDALSWIVELKRKNSRM